MFEDLLSAKGSTRPVGQISAAQIRPPHLMSEYWRLRREDLNMLIDRETGELREELSVIRENPFTHASPKGHVILLKKDGFQFLQCPKTGYVFVNPAPTHAALKKWYGESKSQKFFSQNVVATTAKIRKQNIFRERVAKIGPANGRTLLEVGCSNGIFLQCAEELGWKCVGIDPDPNTCRAASSQTNAEIIHGTIEDADFGGRKFDVVVMWELIEHVLDPLAIAKKVCLLTADDGELHLTTPNFEGIEYRAAGGSHELTSAPEHLNYFSPSTIRLLLEQAGYRQIDVTTPGVMDLDNVMKVVNDEDKPSVGSRFLKELADNVDEDDWQVFRQAATAAIQKNLLSGHMQIAAYKTLRRSASAAASMDSPVKFVTGQPHTGENGHSEATSQRLQTVKPGDEFIAALPYLSISYSFERKPRNNYPDQLIEYLTRSLNVQPGKLLDVGAGRGDFFHVFSDRGFDVYGVDISNESRLFLPTEKFQRINLFTDAQPYPDDTFDYVFCKSVIEHMPLDTHRHFFPEIRRILKPGGRAIFLTVDWRYMYRHFYLEYTHAHPWTRESLSDCLNIYGFQNVSVRRIIQLPAFFKFPRLTWCFTTVVRALNIPHYWKFAKYSTHVMMVATASKPGESANPR